MRLNDLTALLFDHTPPPGRVLFRVDAGRRPGLSFGHLERCHMLAEGLRSIWQPDITFLMADIPDGVKRAETLGETVLLHHPHALHRLAGQFDAVVFDLPDGPSAEDLTLARQAGLWTVVVDDTNRPFAWASAVINSSILARSDHYPSGARLFLGPDYLILPEGFDSPLDRPKHGRNCMEVLISFGGSDPSGLTVKTLAALTKRPWEKAVFKVVTGPGFVESDLVARLVKTSNVSVEVITNPPDLPALMKQADLAVCAGGRTLYELHALNVPAIAIASISHEADQIRAFREQGLISAGFDTFDEKNFIEALQQALENVIDNHHG